MQMLMANVTLTKGPCALRASVLYLGFNHSCSVQTDREKQMGHMGNKVGFGPPLSAA